MSWIVKQVNIFNFNFIYFRGLVNDYITKNRKIADVFSQLKYYNFMFRPSSGHFQELHVNYMDKT
jgi:hypothetical protein